MKKGGTDSTDGSDAPDTNDETAMGRQRDIRLGPKRGTYSLTVARQLLRRGTFSELTLDRRLLRDRG